LVAGVSFSVAGCRYSDNGDANKGVQNGAATVYDGSYAAMHSMVARRHGLSAAPYDAPTTPQDAQDDCETWANLSVTVDADRSTNQWPSRALADFRPWSATVFTKSDDLVVKVANGQVSWTAKPGVAVCLGVWSIRTSAHTGVFRRPDRPINQPSGALKLPVQATGFTLYGWQTKAEPGAGIIGIGASPRDYSDQELANCRQHGNVVATVRRNPANNRWGAATAHTIVPGRVSKPVDSIMLTGRNNLARYSARPGVVVCQLEAGYVYTNRPFVTSVDQKSRNYAGPLDTVLTSNTVLGYDRTVGANGNGDLRRHARR
jgi:hypothetical protein